MPFSFEGDFESGVADVGVGEGEEGPAAEPFVEPVQKIYIVVHGPLWLTPVNEFLEADFEARRARRKAAVAFATRVFPSHVFDDSLAPWTLQRVPGEPVADLSGSLTGGSLAFEGYFFPVSCFALAAGGLGATNQLVGRDLALAGKDQVFDGSFECDKEMSEKPVAAVQL